MALYHFTVSQISRSKGSSAIASAAYRAGEKLHSERYDEDADYTRKGGVIENGILLPEHAPREYSNRETLWNSVEAAEKRADAQLAYSFEFALQNELTISENIALAKRFIRENFVALGMIADYAIHEKEVEEGGVYNPHVHVMCPIRPLTPDGKWGPKQKRVQALDEQGNPIWDEERGRWKYNWVSATGWGNPETLEQWRANWCAMVNEKFCEMGISERLEYKSFVRQGLEQLPQIHEGPTVRAMERQGIPTEKGAYNRWIRASNAMLKALRTTIADLMQWIHEAKEELNRPGVPSIRQILLDYMNLQNTGALGYSKYGRQKASETILRDVSDALNYLQQYNITTPEQLENRIEKLSDFVDEIRDSMKDKSERMKQLREAIDQAKVYQQTLPIYKELGKPKYKFKRAAQVYKNEHSAQLRRFQKAKRILQETGMPDTYDPVIVCKWQQELSRLDVEYKTAYEQLNPAREEKNRLLHIRYCVDRVRKNQEQTATKTRKQEYNID